MFARVSVLAVALGLASFDQVEAHSSMSVPKPTFPDNFYLPMNPFARIDGEKFPGAASVASYKGPEKIAAAMKSTNAKTLRQFVMTNMNVTFTDAVKMPTKECGMSQADGARQPLADVQWTWAHPGPCEVWCDNTRLFFNDNCGGNNVGTVKVDKSKCAGANFIQGMYVGTHVPNWEVYVNCVPLEGGKSTDAAAVFKTNAPGDGAGGEAGADSDGSAAAPTPESPAPVASSSAPKPSSSAPAPAPAPAPATPSSPSTTKKPSCVKRRRN